MCMRRLLHPSYSREKVWQALGSVHLFRLARARPINGCMPQHGNFSPGLASCEGPKGRHGKVSSRRRTSSFSARKSAYMASARIYIASRISTAIVFPPSKKKKRGWKVERVGHGKVFSCRSRDQPSNHKVEKVERACDF